MDLGGHRQCYWLLPLVQIKARAVPTRKDRMVTLPTQGSSPARVGPGPLLAVSLVRQVLKDLLGHRARLERRARRGPLVLKVLPALPDHLDLRDPLARWERRVQPEQRVTLERLDLKVRKAFVVRVVHRVR